MNEQIINKLENLPEELEFTESQWYEYHYYLKRNLFLLEKIFNLSYKPENILVIEPHETYIKDVLKAVGFQVYDDNQDDQNIPISLSQSITQDVPEKSQLNDYDLVLLLNIIECQEDLEKFLMQILPSLKKEGRVFLMTENMTQFKNRLKLLLGRSLLTPSTGNGPVIFRLFTLSKITEILSSIKMKVFRGQLVSPYPPFRMEPLTVRRYLMKYVNYFVMKAVPQLRDTIFIEAVKSETSI